MLVQRVIIVIIINTNHPARALARHSTVSINYLHIPSCMNKINFVLI